MYASIAPVQVHVHDLPALKMKLALLPIFSRPVASEHEPTFFGSGENHHGSTLIMSFRELLGHLFLPPDLRDRKFVLPEYTTLL